MLHVASLVAALAPLQQTPFVDPEGAPAPPPILFAEPRPVHRAPAAQSSFTSSSTLLPLNQDPEGDMPRDVAFTPDGQRVVVVNRDTDNVVVVDFATRQIIATIAVGDFPVDVEVAPDGTVAAVPNLGDDTVSIIDLASLTVSATVPVTRLTGEGQPYRVAFDDASDRIFVSVIDGASSARFSVIDVQTATETLSFPTSPHGAYGGFATPEPGIFGNLFSDWAIAPDGSFLLLPDRGGDALNSYDTATGALIASIPIGDTPAYVDISDDATAAVVSLAGATDAVVSLSLSNGTPTVLGTVPTSVSAFDPRVRITPDKTEAIVAVQNAVEFIDLGALTGLSVVSTGTVGDIEFTFDDQYAVITNFNTRVIDLQTRGVVATLGLAATYDAAVSPTSHRLVGLNNRFGEDLHFYLTGGASSTVLGRRLSGVDPEVDAPRRVTLTEGGRRALIAANTSRSIVDVDLVAGAVTAVLPAGDRVWELATDAAGTVAVVSSTESDTLQIIDLAGSGGVVDELTVPTRPTEVAVSPDGTRAYVTSIAGTDRLWFVDLAGASSAVTGSLITGQLGSIGYDGGQSSGIALSPDGSLLAICVSFDDELLLVDVANQTEVARVPVGDFPLRAAWSSDGAFVFVGCAFDDTVHRVDLGGGAPTVGAVATGVDSPYRIVVEPGDDFIHVGEYGFNVNALAVLDRATMSRVATVALPGRPAAMDRSGDLLFVATGDSVSKVRLAGAATALEESAAISGTAYDLAFSAALGATVTTQPGAEDAIDVTAFGGAPTLGCLGVPNSTGTAGRLAADGVLLAGGYPLEMRATGLPPFQFGLLLASLDTAMIPMAGGSQGTLCLGGTIGRFNASITPANAFGGLSIDVDTTTIPAGAVTASVAPGETWAFQLWHRDLNPGQTSNFTNSVLLPFE